MNKRHSLGCAFLLLTLLFCLSSGAEAGWKVKNGKRMFYEKTTKSYVKSSWKKICGKWYYFDAKGRMRTGRFAVNGQYFYCKQKSGRVHSKKIGAYYYGKDGVMVTETWQKIGGKEFYFGADGKLMTGKIVVDGKTYYCSKEKGRITSLWVKKNYYGEDGVMVTSAWVEDSYVDENGTITDGNMNPKNPPSPEDIRLLAAITYLEAGDQSYYGKQCVASVVMNRVKSKRFPNTLRGVLYQNGQFTPAMNGSLTRLYNSKQRIQAQCVKAAKYVLEHGSVLKGYYFFNNAYGKRKIGAHYFS